MKNNLRKIIREIVEEVLSEAENITDPFAKSSERKPFSEQLMKQAIEQGLEVGLSFKSDNEDYVMPTTKYRIILPVAIGTSKKGNQVVRGFHVVGQSEKEALKSGTRSKEARDAWRLFKTKNIKGMWFTGRTFNENPPGYNPSDKSMNNVSATFNAGKAKSFQEKNQPL